jgi:hypothetical protein
MLQTRMNSYLTNAKPDARHGLPVVWIQTPLSPPQLKASHPARLRRKRPNTASRVSNPDERLHRHKALYNILYLRSTQKSHNDGMNLTVRPVTALANGASAAPVRPAGYAWR